MHANTHSNVAVRLDRAQHLSFFVCLAINQSLAFFVVTCTSFLLFSIQAMYAMEINVEKDTHTGETKILSASTIGPEGVHPRGVKVYEDGTKVVYEVRSAGAVVENGVHRLSSKDVEELIQKAGQSSLRGGRGSERTAGADGSLGHPKDHVLCKEAKLEMVHKSRKDRPSGNPGQQARAPGSEGPQAHLDQPVTMIFMG